MAEMMSIRDVPLNGWHQTQKSQCPNKSSLTSAYIDRTRSQSNTRRNSNWTTFGGAAGYFEYTAHEPGMTDNLVDIDMVVASIIVPSWTRESRVAPTALSTIDVKS